MARSVYTHTLETIAPLHARYIAGEEPELLAAELGITRNALLSQFHHKGLGGRVKRHWWTSSELKLAKDRLERGLSLEETARLFDVDPQRLYRELLKAGYSAKANKRIDARAKRDSEDHAMYNLRREGNSYSQIAIHMGWPAGLSGQRRVGARISKYCFRAGIPTPMVKEILRRDGTRRRVGYGERVRMSLARRAEEARKGAAEDDGRA
jgi:hypothetical protein